MVENFLLKPVSVINEISLQVTLQERICYGIKLIFWCKDLKEICFYKRSIIFDGIIISRWNDRKFSNLSQLVLQRGKFKNSIGIKDIFRYEDLNLKNVFNNKASFFS